MRTHVFIVNEQTFPIHLQYLFAGTGSQDKDEHISLLADIKRVRPGDFVIFYIEATTKQKGGFYGIFKIAESEPLVFHTPQSSGFNPGLSKKLIYRTLIEPYEVYEDKVLEFDALDKLPTYASEIQWSLIYRKLKGKRGCTPLLPWEAERLINMIRNVNQGRPIADYTFNGGFNFDIENKKIVTTSSRTAYYFERQYNYEVLSDIYEKKQAGKAYEIYLQLFLTENISINPDLNKIVGESVIWFGNEIACGVGMQKIDILTINQMSDRREYRIIELKDEPIEPDITEQLAYYVKWASQDYGKHLEGAFSWNIQPVIIAPKHNKRKWPHIRFSLIEFNRKQIALPILYFEFDVDENRNIIFNRVDYST